VPAPKANGASRSIAATWDLKASQSLSLRASRVFVVDPMQTGVDSRSYGLS